MEAARMGEATSGRGTTGGAVEAVRWWGMRPICRAVKNKVLMEAACGGWQVVRALEATEVLEAAGRGD